MDVETWLKGIGLEQYAEAFAENGVDAGMLPELTNEDLKDLGVTRLADRKQILKAIAATTEEAGSEPSGTLASQVEENRPEATAERRQLTVMFVDLVGSTALSHRLDPEELREVLRAYQETCAAVVRRYEGHIAKYIGDGLLVYFGYPQAHEDDAPRAVRSGLGIIAAVKRLDKQLRAEKRVALSVHLGIHTGLVVVGEMGAGETREEMAIVGETPNIAARLQDLAEPNTVIISSSTFRLAGGQFEYENLGAHPLKGISEPVQVWQVIGEHSAESRFEAMQAAGLTPFVGREQEIALLLERWEQVKGSEGQVVLLSGEAGIGKSRITQILRERIAQDPHTRLRYQCSPYHTNSALFPVIRQLEFAARIARDDTSELKLDKLDSLLAQSAENVQQVAPLFAALLSIPAAERYAPLNMTPQRQKEKTLEALTEQLIGLATRHSVLFLLEDAHWIDPTTQELIELTISRVQELRVLVVITFRPEFKPPWRSHAHITSLTLNRLGHRQCTTMVEKVTAGKPLPMEVLNQIVAKTDGMPLFVEELTKTVLESGLVKDEGDHYKLTGPLPPLAIPTTLRDSLTARLDRLGPLKEVAQIGAAIGRRFSYDLLAAISPFTDSGLQDALIQLTKAELIYRRGTPPEAIYTFKHALVQDAAYSSLLRSKRKVLHAQIAQELEHRFPKTMETEPEVLAQHYTGAGLKEQAIAYWQKAGMRALRHSASKEAVTHFTRGLKLLTTLPETPEHTQQELDLQTALGSALMAVRGWSSPGVERAYTRARQLCRRIGESPKLFRALRGLFAFYLVRAELQMAREVGEQLLGLAQRAQDPALLLEAHRAFGQVLGNIGEFDQARAHLEKAMALYDPQQHRSHALIYGYDPGAAGLSNMVWTLLLLGYPDRALETSQRALTLADQLAHPFSSAYVLGYLAWQHLFRREWHLTQEWAEKLLALSEYHGFEQSMAWGTILRGWALTQQRSEKEGIEQMRQGLNAYLATGAGLWQSCFLALLAERYRKRQQVQAGPEPKQSEALILVDQALATAHKNEERFYEAELYRLKGEFLLCLPERDRAAAEACFNRALAIAGEQSARMWELRAAMSLARLWRSQNKTAKARDLLAPVYGWFTEGFDAPDLKDAKALLDELA